MKIGVVTYWYGNSNYGMILQCWALQKYLKKLGHDPYVIRYQPKSAFVRALVKKLITSVKCIVSYDYRCKVQQDKMINDIEERRNSERCFQSFRDSNLQMSDKYYKSLRELKKEPPYADCYIAGSDQIWSGGLQVPNTWGYYLAFGSTETKRVAYAPSFGRVGYVPAGGEKRLKKALSNFDFLSCREHDAVQRCKSLGFDCQKVEDPTLLLSIEDYQPLIETMSESDYVYIYSVNIRASEDVYFNKLKSVFPQKKIIVTTASGNSNSGEIFGADVEYNYATPGKWLSLIWNSDFFVTSSFHGVVFSIILNKKFAFVPIKGSYAKANNRITDLLKDLNLEDLIINNPEDYERIKCMNVDWGKVNKSRLELIDASIRFLKRALNE